MSKNPWCHLDAPMLTKLDLASVLIREIFEDTPYLVGSCMTRPDYRDVDVRIILTDERFDALFPRPHADPLRHFNENAITDYYVNATGLRIDFQIQRQTEANAKYPGVRHPLGLYVSNEDN